MSCLFLDPMVTTNALGSFGVQSDGYVQGVALSDPANRLNLSSGTVAATETKPLWDGLPAAELLPGSQSSPRSLTIRHMVSVAELKGFIVFNQAHNGLATPQPPVPLYAFDMDVLFYRLGLNVRAPLKASTQVIALATSDASAKTVLAWSFVSSQIVTTAAAGFAGVDITTTAPAYASDVATATTVSAHEPTAGQYVKISDVASSAYNGTVAVLSVPSATTFTHTPVTAPDSAATTQGTIGAATFSDITLSVKVLVVETSNFKIVTYDNSIGFLTWNNDDSCVPVLL